MSSLTLTFPLPLLQTKRCCSCCYSCCCPYILVDSVRIEPFYLREGRIRPRPQPPLPLSHPRYKNCSRNFRRSCVPAPILPSRSTASYITSSQVVPPLCSPALGGWTQKNTASPKRSSLPWKNQVLFAAQTCLRRPRCTWSPRRTVRGGPAATTAA